MIYDLNVSIYLGFEYIVTVHIFWHLDIVYVKFQLCEKKLLNIIISVGQVFQARITTLPAWGKF